MSELQGYDDQLAAIRRDAEALLDGLGDRQLEWQPDVRSWSIAECLNHLAVTGNQSLANIRTAISAARAQGWVSAGPFRHPVAGNLFIRLMDAPPLIRFKAPAGYQPEQDMSAGESVAAFWSVQNALIDALKDANGVDLARVKVANPVSNWFKLTLGQEFALTAAHERRHLWQARRVREALVSSGVAA